jgi:hypothetical protein
MRVGLGGAESMDEGQDIPAGTQGGPPRPLPRPDREELFAKAVCITGTAIIWAILALIVVGYILGYGRL